MSNMAYAYQQEVFHKGLNKYKIVKADSPYELNEKVRALKAQWEEQWQKKLERETKLKNAEEGLKYASEQTKEAENVQYRIDNLLINSLGCEKFDFNVLKDYSKFDERKPYPPKQKDYSRQPLRSDEVFNPQPPFWVKISKKKREEFVKENDARYSKAYELWRKEADCIDEENKMRQNVYNNLVDEWQNRKDNFYKQQEEKNNEVDTFKGKFLNGDTEAIENYFDVILARAEIPFYYDRNVDIEYIKESKNLIIDLYLPTKEDMPTLKSLSYVKSKSEYKEAYFSESQMKKKYDDFIYQMVLQTLYLVFNSSGEIVDSIVLNGRVSTVDKSTGKHIEPYVLSINVNKENFEDLNLQSIDAKAWFKSSKGVSAATFANVTAVAPIVQMQKEDKRFIEGYSVVNDIDDSMNLATMDWQDFENLIREIFEKEFNSTGGEVKITQASRDGGVDAVAFDPDPIRGGKIVIQAKRYTNVVGVSAVRDLYGTVMNEGAIKGILVTTSNYGNDAYEFAKGKPLTLMNGANLLYLLERHGHRAKIDLNEAKKFFAEQK